MPDIYETYHNLQKLKSKAKHVRGTLRMEINDMVDKQHGSINVGENNETTKAM